MKTKTIKKVLLYTLSALLVLVIVLFVHIYMVYRPKAPDAYTKVMARIDIKQRITPADANKIAAWMYHQKGVDHVLVNPESDIVVFTFFPIQVNGNQIVDNFKAAFHLKADRFMPTEQQLSSGCPAGGTSSYAYKIYQIINKII
jgi:hypothetical protein